MLYNITAWAVYEFLHLQGVYQLLFRKRAGEIDISVA